MSTKSVVAVAVSPAMSSLAFLAALDSETTSQITATVGALLTAVAGAGATAGIWRTARRTAEDTENQIDTMRVVLNLHEDRKVETGSVPQTPMERRAEQRFELQMGHYADAKRNRNGYFYASLITGVVGFVAIVMGGIAAVSGVVDYGSVAAAGGLLIEGGAAFVFKQASDAGKEAQSNLREITATAEESDKREMAKIYAERIEDPALRNEVFAQLAIEAIGSDRAPKALTSGPSSSPALRGGQ